MSSPATIDDFERMKDYSLSLYFIIELYGNNLSGQHKKYFFSSQSGILRKIVSV